jgi:hypothetical protein
MSSALPRHLFRSGWGKHMIAKYFGVLLPLAALCMTIMPANSQQTLPAVDGISGKMSVNGGSSDGNAVGGAEGATPHGASIAANPSGYASPLGARGAGSPGYSRRTGPKVDLYHPARSVLIGTGITRAHKARAAERGDTPQEAAQRFILDLQGAEPRSNKSKPGPGRSFL